MILQLDYLTMPELQPNMKWCRQARTENLDCFPNKDAIGLHDSQRQLYAYCMFLIIPCCNGVKGRTYQPLFK